MVELNNVENAMLTRMETRAKALRNGGKGNIETISEAVADIIEVLAAMVRTGGVTPEECAAMHREFMVQIARDRSDHIRTILDAELKQLRAPMTWKAALAVTLPICLAAVSIALPVVLHLVKTP